MLDHDDEDDWETYDEDWYGIVNQRPAGVAGTWVIGGRAFTASESTRLMRDDGPIAVGSCVSVDYDGSRAFEIESEPAHDCTSGGSDW